MINRQTIETTVNKLVKIKCELIIILGSYIKVFRLTA